MELVALAEIEEMLGSTTARVHQLAATKTFAEPVASLQAGHVWAWPDVEKGAKATGREIVKGA